MNSETERCIEDGATPGSVINPKAWRPATHLNGDHGYPVIQSAPAGFELRDRIRRETPPRRRATAMPWAAAPDLRPNAGEAMAPAPNHTGYFDEGFAGGVMGWLPHGENWRTHIGAIHQFAPFFVAALVSRSRRAKVSRSLATLRGSSDAGTGSVMPVFQAAAEELQRSMEPIEIQPPSLHR
jgi:hypothetical protein